MDPNEPIKYAMPIELLSLPRAQAPDMASWEEPARYGRIYPVDHNKRPLKSSRWMDLSCPTKIANLQRWREKPSCHGFGLTITSARLIVFDCENKFKHGTDQPGDDGIAYFDQWWRSHVDALPDSLVVQSASDGLHYYFLLPEDLIPRGKYLTGKPIQGCDLLTCGRNAMMPGTRAEVIFGTGEYTIVAGRTAGIVEMPRALALALLDITTLEDLENLGKKKVKTRSPQRSQSSAAAALDAPTEAEVLAAVARLSQINKRFLPHWNNEPVVEKKSGKAADHSRSGRWFAITKIAVFSRYRKAMALALVQLWCKRHSKNFDLPRWESQIYAKVFRLYHQDQENRAAKQSELRRDLEKGEEEERKNYQVYKHPPISPPFYGQESDWLPLPKRPSDSKQAAFDHEEKAHQSLAGSRPKFDTKYFDDPANQEWQRTKSYLISVGYFAFKAGCNKDEVLWYLVQFVKQHAPDFWITRTRLKTILDRAKGRRKSVLTRPQRMKAAALNPGSQIKKPRKPRSDKGTSKRLRQVASLMEKGLGYRRIASALKIEDYTAKGYCTEVRKRGGPDWVLRPKKRRKAVPVFVSPLAQFLHDAFAQKEHPIQWRTANSVISKAAAYADKLGHTSALTQELIHEAVAHPPNPKSKKPIPLSRRLLTFLQESIATTACLADKTVAELAYKIEDNGLPSTRINPKTGQTFRTNMGFSQAVLRAKQAVSNLRNWRVPCDFVEDAETIWRYSETHGGLREGVNRLGQEQEDRLFTPMLQDHVAA